MDSLWIHVFDFALMGAYSVLVVTSMVITVGRKATIRRHQIARRLVLYAITAGLLIIAINLTTDDQFGLVAWILNSFVAVLIYFFNVRTIRNLQQAEELRAFSARLRRAVHRDA